MSIGDGANSLALSRGRIEALRAAGATRSDLEVCFGPPRETFESRAVRWLHDSRSPGSRNYRIRRVGLGRDGTVTAKRSEIHWD